MVGLAALVVPLPVHRSAVLFEWPVMLAATVLMVGVAWDGHVGRGDGLAFLAVLVAFHAFIIYRAGRGFAPESVQEFEAAAGPDVSMVRVPPWVAITALVAGGAAMLALGGHLMVEGGIALARLAGVSERVIGLTILAVGTSLPELAASLMAAWRNQLDIALANAMGSNIFNLLGILGATALVRPVPVAAGFLHADVWWMLGFTVLIAPLMYTGRRITRPEGALLLAAYVGYVGLLLASR
jgi:cation:H+ antiporter